ncbi:hypothetical protein FRC17_007139, partial [Serendipita sp. 399]
AFKSSHYHLGKLGPPFYAITVLFQGLVFAVDISPFFFPVTAAYFNFAPVILGAVTIFAILSWWLTPESKWLRYEHLKTTFEGADGVKEHAGEHEQIKNPVFAGSAAPAANPSAPITSNQ